jgi:glyoxylase-like metal-dependent hydrolase (beta-lactamase superfamily II)
MFKLNVCEGIHWIEDGYVNFYIVEDGNDLTVIDAGLPSSWDKLKETVAALGRKMSAIKSLVLTHAHFDHLGFAEKLRQTLRIPVWAHKDEQWLSAHPLRYAHERNRLFYPLRYPRSIIPLSTMAAKGAFFVKGVNNVQTFKAEKRLDVAGHPEVVFTPGHTFGHCSLFFRERNCLIAGDAIVLFNPYTSHHGPQIVSGAATADSSRALDSLESLESTRAKTVLTGHGEPWTQGIEKAVKLARQKGPS